MSEKVRLCEEYKHIDQDNYSIHHGGIAIPVDRFYQEPETSCKRALPDVEALADQMYLLLKDDALREKMGKEARQCAEDNYDWNELAERWEHVLDGVKPLDRSTTWNKKHVVREIPNRTPVPTDLSDEKFIEFLYLKVLGYPRIDPSGVKHWLTVLQSGQTREQVYEMFYNTLTQEGQRENVINQMLQTKDSKKKDDGQLSGETV
jgi:hypothetical protein